MRTSTLQMSSFTFIFLAFVTKRSLLDAHGPFCMDISLQPAWYRKKRKKLILCMTSPLDHSQYWLDIVKWCVLAATFFTIHYYKCSKKSHFLPDSRAGISGFRSRFWRSRRSSGDIPALLWTRDMDNNSSLAVTYDLKQKNPGGSSQFGSQFLHTCLYISDFGANNVHIQYLHWSRVEILRVRMRQARTDISARTRDSGSDPIATYVSVCRRYKYMDKGMLFAFCFHCHRL